MTAARDAKEEPDALRFLIRTPQGRHHGRPRSPPITQAPWSAGRVRPKSARIHHDYAIEYRLPAKGCLFEEPARRNRSQRVEHELNDRHWKGCRENIRQEGFSGLERAAVS